MIHVISSLNRHQYLDIIESHFRIRHDIFVDERGWEALRKSDGREIDKYDNDETVYLLALDGQRVVGGHRLYPTVMNSMMGDVFPHLASVRGVPCSPVIWEWSRYFVAKDRRDGDLNLRLMAAVQEFCLDQGIEHVSAIMETWWLPRFQQAGFSVSPLGLPALVENQWTMAATIEISAETASDLLERIGVDSVLHAGPHPRLVERAIELAA